MSHRIPAILKQLSEPTCPFSNAHSWETYPKTPMFLGEPFSALPTSGEEGNIYLYENGCMAY